MRRPSKAAISEETRLSAFLLRLRENTISSAAVATSSKAEVTQAKQPMVPGRLRPVNPCGTATSKAIGRIAVCEDRAMEYRCGCRRQRPGDWRSPDTAPPKSAMTKTAQSVKPERRTQQAQSANASCHDVPNLSRARMKEVRKAGCGRCSGI